MGRLKNNKLFFSISSLSGNGKYIINLLLFLSVAIVFIWNVKQYFFLSDDCFITFRYASNLYHGYGLTWNPGERVEGYTNFLWVILMAFGMVFNITPEIFSNILGIASGFILLMSLVYLSATFAGWGNPFIWLAPLVLSLSQNFSGWCTGGLATMFFTTVLFLAFLIFLHEREKAVRFPLVSSLLFILSYLTRPDALLFMFIAAVFFLIDVFLKRRKLVSFVAWLTPFIFFVGTHLLWRYYYYGYWLPNTFYAKVNGLWWKQGYLFFSLFNQQYKIVFFLPLLFIPLLLHRKFVYTMFFTLLIAYSAYLFGIGGDRFAFRFLIYIFPYFYWLLSEGLRLLTVVQTKQKAIKYILTVISVGISITLVIVTHQRSTYKPTRAKLHHGIVSIQSMKKYANRRIREGKILRLLIKEDVLPKDIILCVPGAGAVPYYTQWPTIDFLGLNDTKIAHKSIKRRRTIAHEKHASQRYLRERKVELFDYKNRLISPYPFINERCDTNKGCRKSIKIGKYYLNFKTYLTEEEYLKRFEKALSLPKEVVLL